MLFIDEKSVRKKHNYVTLVINVDTSELLYRAEGKKKESLEGFILLNVYFFGESGRYRHGTVEL